MNIIKHKAIRSFTLFGLIVLAFSCTRDLEELELATFPTDADVFLDGFTGGLNFDAFAGSKVTAFEVDMDETFAGNASMRFSVPDPNDPAGGYAGGAFYLDAGRDLSGYDALTFWGRASKAANIDQLGFGNDFDDSPHQVNLRNVPMTTNWQKYVVPIPDPSILKEERGMFHFTEAPEDGRGFTFWIDEVKFEKLGTLARPQPIILAGQNQSFTAETGDSLIIEGLQMSHNLPTGVDQVSGITPNYFTFTSSNTSVATVNEVGKVMVIDSGQAVITAAIGELAAIGSLTIQSSGDPLLPPTIAPLPTANPDSVISMFSNVYDDVLVDTWNPFWEFSTTELDDVKIGEDDVKRYKKLNFVGILTESEQIDATEMTHFHMDIWTPDPTATGVFRVLLVDFGPDGNFGGGDDSSHEVTFTSPTLASEEWVSLDIPLTSFAGLTRRSNIAQLVISGDLPNVFVDNVYYYIKEASNVPQEPSEAAPAPTRDAANVISLFSDVYTNVPVDTWRTDWSAAVFEDVTIADNPTKKYSALDFVGIETVANTVDASQMTTLHMDVWSPDFTNFAIKLVDFGADGGFGGGDDTEHQIEIAMPGQGEWQSLDIPLADFENLQNRSNLAQYILVGQPTGLTTVFVDNFYFYNGDNDGGSGATEPQMPAPTPTEAAANVVSLFSDAYTDVAVDTWRTDWSVTDYEDITIQDNPTKKYSNLDFAGIETVSSTVDASNMTNLRLDVWSPDFTRFSIKLVDFGADGAFGGGDDTEHQVDLEMPGQGAWQSLDLPLSDFVNLTSRSNLAQYIIVAQPTGTSTVFIDNFYFYGEGGSGGAMEPQMPAPTPTEAATNVVSLFSDAYTDVAVDTWRTDWSVADYEDITVEGNPTKKYSNLDFAGIETVSSTVDASNMTNLRLDVWSPDFTRFSIKLVDFGADGAFGGGDDSEHQVDFEMPGQGAWQSMDIPLSDFVNLTNRSNLAQYIIVAQPTGTATVFVDNFYFYGDGSNDGGSGAMEPQMPAPTPTEAAANVVSLFSDAYTDVAVDTWRTDWSVTDYEDITVEGNPTKKYSNLDFAGIETVSSTVDASNMTNLRLDVWSPDFTRFSIKLVDFGADGAFGGGDDSEHQVDFEMPGQGAWQSMDIPLSDFVNLTNRSNLAQYIIVAQPTGTATVFVDNFYFYGDGSNDGGSGATEPQMPAPAPTKAQADVISLFSDVYTDAAVDTWRTDWSATTFEDVTVDGNPTKKYTDLDFAGIETVANMVDATEMTTLHLNVWSPDFTRFSIKLVDFGADGAFGGGDDTEHQVDIEMPGQGAWQALEIPLSDFTNLLNRANLAQYIIVAQPTGTATVFLDNFYFSK